MFKLINLKSKFDLAREKQKDFRNVVIVQSIIVVLTLTLSQPLLDDPSSDTSKLIISIFSFLGALNIFLMWDLLRNFTLNRTLILTILIVLCGIVFTGILVEFPYYQMLKVSNRQVYLLILHSTLFPIEVIVISFAIRDIFSGGYFTPDKLWGAACVFLMFGFSFGSM